MIPACWPNLYRRLTFGLESHQASLGQTVRDPKGLEFKPNGVIPPVGLGPVRAKILISLLLVIATWWPDDIVSSTSIEGVYFGKALPLPLADPSE